MRLDSMRKMRNSGLTVLASLVAVTLAFAATVSSAATLPTPPLTFDAAYVAPTGATITVNAGGDLQAALNSARLGDTIVLQAGANFQGPFTLPNKTTGSGWIYIQSSAYGNLPAPGSRVAPSNAANMPKIRGGAGNGSLITTADGAHHFRFVGIEFTPDAGQYVYSVISLGNGDASSATLPNNITFDRCFVHGDAQKGARRGIAMNGMRIAVVESYVSDFKEVGADSQALWAFNTPGPLKIVNNYIEAAGENVMFGGAQSVSEALNPSDIEIRNNNFFKPLSWLGGTWSVKNLLEFKNAFRVIVEGNTFENNWAASQQGFAILITPRNENGTAPWEGTQDIAFVSNVGINLGSGINISGIDGNFPDNDSQRTKRILVANNLLRVTGANGADGRAVQIINGPLDVTVDHNTLISIGVMAMSESAGRYKTENFKFTNNIFVSTSNSNNFIGTGTPNYNATVAAFYVNAIATNNVITNGNVYPYSSATWSSGNFFPDRAADIQFVDYAGGDYRLAATSPYKNKATDGTDVGALVGQSIVLPRPTVPRPPLNVVIVQ